MKLKIFLLLKIIKSALVRLLNIKKVDKFFTLLLILSSTLYLFVILVNNFEVVYRIIEIILGIKVNCLAI